MASAKKGLVLSSIDARRGNCFGMIIDNNKNEYVINEALISYEDLKNNKYDIEVNEDNYIVDPIYVLNNKKIVEEPHLLVPNYLRDTEAERNINA